MKHFIIADERESFLGDFSTRMLIDDISLSTEVITNTNVLINSINKNLNKNTPFAVVINANMCDSFFEANHFNNLEIYGYVNNKEDFAILEKYKLFNIGLIKASSELIQIINQKTIPVVQKQEKIVEEKNITTTNNNPSQNLFAQKINSYQGDVKTPVVETIPTPAPIPTPVVSEPIVSSNQIETMPQNNISQPTKPIFQPEWRCLFCGELNTSKFCIKCGKGQNATQSPPAQQQFQTQQPQFQTQNPQSPQNYQTQTDIQNMFIQQMKTPTYNPPQLPDNYTHPSENVKNIQQERYGERIDRAIEGDKRNNVLSNKGAVVVAFYSAKGGVGKTTISSETATSLAMSYTGNRPYKVCIVDYNIDFGDVTSTLGFETRGATMLDWAMDIRRRLQQGESKADIKYTRQEIETKYLQYKHNINLFGLLAPLNHEDSLNIKSVELEIMLDNIVNYGGFDYVICDTGNNTRDASMIAVEKAHSVMLIVTQDINAINCDISVVNALNKLGVNTSKISLIINKIMPSKTTGIDIQTVKNVLPYQCITEIKDSVDIVRANNDGTPLIFNKKHDYGNEISNIVSFLTMGQVQATTKKSLKKKKGKIFR